MVKEFMRCACSISANLRGVLDRRRFDRAECRVIVRREQQEVVFTMAIPLGVVVLGELSYGAAQRGELGKLGVRS